ncbi:hypothetical protein GGX14DRAFT_470409 [Mycena pura]|uniref:F-box domain-containing protein n=1 Tax=Mycena pura TaxID=153505 RepID=A0AAD6Y5T3_9AGAR|nr:hypothetical protein GGX14DRAFT_470409 [Mycena pura]
MQLLDLPSDILLRILHNCDVSSLRSASQANKSFHDLVFTRIIWISLVQDLRYRGFVDGLSADDVKAMSTPELIALMRRLVLGPRCAGTPASLMLPRRRRLTLSTKLGSGACVARTRVLHPTIPPRHLFSQHDVVLLPRGEYLLLNNATGLECWRVADDALVWRYQSDVPSARVKAFAADVRDGGGSVNLVICVVGAPPGYSHVRIVSLTFSTRTAQHLLQTQVGAPFGDPITPRIYGDFAAVRMQNQSFVVFDWRSETYCNIGESHCKRITMDFIPGHFISASSQRIEVFSMTALAGKWSPAGITIDLGGFNKVMTGRISPVVADSVRPKAMLNPMVTVSVHPSPLGSGMVRVWVFLCPDPTFSRFRIPGSCHSADDDDVHIFCFRLGHDLRQTAGASASASTNAQPPLQLRRLKTLQASFELRCHSIAYAGHTVEERVNYNGLYHRGVEWVVSRAGPIWEPVVLPLVKPRAGTDPVVAAYSGAVTYLAEDGVVVQYYE